MGLAQRDVDGVAHVAVCPERRLVLRNNSLQVGGEGCVARVALEPRRDRSGRRRERMATLPDTAYFTLAPDWVCEVLSASTRRLDLHGKRPVYGREGVGHLWLVDPTDRTLEAVDLREGQWVLIASAKDDEPVSIRACDATTFSLSDLWP